MKLPFEQTQRLWIEFMVNRLADNIIYGKTLGENTVLTYEEWIKPDMYYIDGINQKELPITCINGKDYFSADMETFNEWYNKL